MENIAAGLIYELRLVPFPNVPRTFKTPSFMSGESVTTSKAFNQIRTTHRIPMLLLNQLSVIKSKSQDRANGYLRSFTLSFFVYSFGYLDLGDHFSYVTLKGMSKRELEQVV